MKPRIVVKKRESPIAGQRFPFEVAHHNAPAQNMQMFHWHDFVELSYVEKGKGLYEIENKKLPVEKGDLIVINNIERHRVGYNESDPLYETVIHFHPSLIWSKERTSFDYQYLKLFLYEGADFVNKPMLENKTKGYAAELVRSIVREYDNKNDHYELMIKADLLALITILLRASPVSALTGQDRYAQIKKIDALESILRYINANFRESLSLTTVADRFGFNASYFSEYFKKNIGTGFLEYLTNVRIQASARLLDESTMNAAQIALSCGFSNPTSFFLAFKKAMALSPGEYRNRKT